MINIKTPEEISIMKECGKISVKALRGTMKALRAGISTLELDKIADEIILREGGKPSFKTVGGYKYTTCININRGLVHGLPGKYKIKTGDVVSIDLGTLYRGFHTDLSYTLEVETDFQKKFLETGLLALDEGISKCVVGNKLGDVSNSIQTIVENAGYSVSRQLVGHGIGKSLHEDPYVPGYGKAKTGPTLAEGMAFAVEVIYQKGRPPIKVTTDGWTIETRDGSLSALFEKTVVITKNGPLIITDFTDI